MERCGCLTSGQSNKSKTYSFDDVKKNHPDAYKSRSSEEEAKTLSLVRANISINEISKTLGKLKEQL